MSIVDSFDAMLSQRPYKKPIPIDEVLDIIRQARGQAFDPDIVDTFLANTDEFRNVARMFAD